MDNLVTVRYIRVMFSVRFQLPVVISIHARIRMVERDVSEAVLLEVIDFGDTRYKDATHLWCIYGVSSKA